MADGLEFQYPGVCVIPLGRCGSDGLSPSTLIDIVIVVASGLYVGSVATKVGGATEGSLVREVVGSSFADQFYMFNSIKLFVNC